MGMKTWLKFNRLDFNLFIRGVLLLFQRNNIGHANCLFSQVKQALSFLI